MTRAERERQLNELLKTEEGAKEIARIFKQECPKTGPNTMGTPDGLMVSQILDQEFPPIGLAHCESNA
jgi:hypothetical protein